LAPSYCISRSAPNVNAVGDSTLHRKKRNINEMLSLNHESRVHAQSSLDGAEESKSHLENVFAGSWSLVSLLKKAYLQHQASSHELNINDDQKVIEETA
jgi:hypothetical protein